MPTYEYEATQPTDCPRCHARFEMIQRMADAPLTACPDCGAVLQRVFSAPAIQGAGRSGETLSNKNLAEKGFTKYVKAGDGHYEKATGKGPDVIKR